MRIVLIIASTLFLFMSNVSFATSDLETIYLYPVLQNMTGRNVYLRFISFLPGAQPYTHSYIWDTEGMIQIPDKSRKPFAAVGYYLGIQVCATYPDEHGNCPEWVDVTRFKIEGDGPCTSAIIHNCRVDCTYDTTMGRQSCTFHN